MEDKIEIGEYVRIKGGYIRKLIKEFDQNTSCYIVGKPYYNEKILETTKGIVLKEDIVNHSKNIIDLIEVGDYVNGHLVVDRKNDEGRVEIAIESDHIIYYWIEEKDIKSIVTKEQFDSIKYEV